MPTRPDKTTVIYDDLCPMCTFQMRAIGRLDWFGALELLPASAPRAEQLTGVARDQLLTLMHCVTPSGRMAKGARAVRMLGFRVPLLVPLSVLLWVPGVIWIAEWVYRRVANNRYVLSRVFGCDQMCSVPPREDNLGQDTAESTASTTSGSH